MTHPEYQALASPFLLVLGSNPQTDRRSVPPPAPTLRPEEVAAPEKPPDAGQPDFHHGLRFQVVVRLKRMRKFIEKNY